MQNYIEQNKIILISLSILGILLSAFLFLRLIYGGQKQSVYVGDDYEETLPDAVIPS